MFLVVAICSVAVMATLSPVRAEVSPQDGYGPGGAYQVHVELAPYLFLPATSGSINLGNGASKEISAGIPSLSKILSALNGAFFGAGVVRYGPWSGELNIDYVSASVTKGLGLDQLGNPRSLKVSPSLVRVAPGIGYQVFNGALGTIPTTLDARVGFSYFSSNTTLTLDRTTLIAQEQVASVSGGGSFTQPWAGLRAAIYPWPRWRFAVDAQAQGFGVGGGVWGWGATATATWALKNWLNLIAGYGAISTGREFGSRHVISSLRLTNYGPLLGVEFTF